MAYPLCVLTKYLGGRSETFIEAHTKLLMPNQTCLAVAVAAPKAQRAWDFEGPLLVLRHPNKWVRMATYLVTLTRSVGLTERRALPRLQAFLKENGSTHVLSEYLDVGPTYIRRVRAEGLKWYSFGHGYDVSRSLQSLFWRSLYLGHREADGIFVRSGPIRERLVALGIDRQKILVTPGGANVAETPVHHGAKETVRFLHVGRLVPKKGIEVTIQAFRGVLDRLPKAELWVIGAGPDDVLARKTIQNLGLEQSVKLLGPKAPDEVVKAFRDCDVFVLHSRKDPKTGDEEGLPTVVLEAMGQGLPIVSTIHAGIPEAVDSGVHGLLVEENNGVGMAEAMLRLAEDWKLRAQMGEAAYERARREFTWDAEKARILQRMGLGQPDGLS